MIYLHPRAVCPGAAARQHLPTSVAALPFKEQCNQPHSHTSLKTFPVVPKHMYNTRVELASVQYTVVFLCIHYFHYLTCVIFYTGG